MEKDDLQTRMMDFLRKVRNQAERSRGNNVMLTMGSDFQFENAFVNFKSLDLLIDQINSMEGIADVFPEFDGVKAFYSNPEIYTEYKYKEYTYNQWVKKNISEAMEEGNIRAIDPYGHARTLSDIKVVDSRAQFHTINKMRPKQKKALKMEIAEKIETEGLGGVKNFFSRQKRKKEIKKDFMNNGE